MASETKVNNLMERMNRRCNEASVTLAVAQEARVKALQVSSVLPEELLNTEWWSFFKQEDKKWYMETMGIRDPDEADKLIKVLRLMGVYGIKSSHDKFSNTWFYKGTFQVGEDTITIKVDGGSQPPACRIEKIVEMKKVTTYKAICEDTEEEL